MELVLCEPLADETVESGSGREDSSDRNRKAGGQCGLLHREPTEEGGQNQGDFGRQAGVILVRPPIGDGGQ